SIALDSKKRPSRVLASNQGHLLWADAVKPDRAEAICRALMGSSSYSGWGVRTLSSDERAFNPVGYHTGTVWPHDNALFAVGLRIRRPSLPRQVNRASVEGLRVGDARVDLLFERVAERRDSVALTDVRIDGQLDVVLEIQHSGG